MRLPLVLLALSLVLLFLLGVVPWVLPTDAGPGPHPRIESMQRGGAGGPPWLAWTAGLAIVTFLGVAMAMGLARGAMRWIWTATAGYAAVYALMVANWVGLEGGATEASFLGFPVPAALLVYGIYLFPLALLLIPTLGFRRWLWTADSEARFQSLTAGLHGPRDD